MKQFYRRTFWLISLFLVILMAPNLFADETLSQKGLLWQIDRQGLNPSYLFGTIHSEDARVNQLPLDVRSRFEQADSVSLEVLMDISTMLKVAHAMFFMGDNSLDKLISKELYAKVVKALIEYDMPSIVVKKLKPWAVIVTLSTPPSKTGEVLDLRLYRKARKLQIPTYGLEKVEEQLNIFEDIPLDDQVTLLKDTLEYLDKMPIIFDKLHELYLERDLTALMRFSVKYMRDSSDNQTLMDAFYKRIVDDRNSRMVRRMEERLQEGNAFIAVGALHLPGKKGLLKLLQTRGYRVSALY
jgi:hypothetical protein